MKKSEMIEDRLYKALYALSHTAYEEAVPELLNALDERYKPASATADVNTFVDDLTAKQKMLDQETRDLACAIVKARKLKTLEEAEDFAAAWIATAAQGSRDVEFLTADRGKWVAEVAQAVKDRDRAEKDLLGVRDQLCKVEDEFAQYRRTSVSIESAMLKDKVIAKMRTEADALKAQLADVHAGRERALKIVEQQRDKAEQDLRTERTAREQQKPKPDSFWRSRCAKLEESLAIAHRDADNARRYALPDHVIQVLQNIAAPAGEGVPYVPYNPTSRERQTVRRWLDGHCNLVPRGPVAQDATFATMSERLAATAPTGGTGAPWALGARVEEAFQASCSAASAEATIAGLKVGNAKLKEEMEAVRKHGQEILNRQNRIAQAVGLPRFYNEENILPRVQSLIETLWWYADTGNYTLSTHNGVNNDAGERARLALRGR